MNVQELINLLESLPPSIKRLPVELGSENEWFGKFISLEVHATSVELICETE